VASDSPLLTDAVPFVGPIQAVCFLVALLASRVALIPIRTYQLLVTSYVIGCWKQPAKSSSHWGDRTGEN